MTIAVLGGSFDPPHIGHYFVLTQILEKRKDMDKIILMPQFQHQWKPMHADIASRLTMLSFLKGPKIEISELEIKRKGITYTLDTVKELRKQMSGKIYWIVGSDILYEYEKWDNTEGLLKLMTFLVFPREGYKIPKTMPFGFEALDNKDFVMTNISSTIIRKRIRENKSITSFVPEEVEKYIKQNNLYK